MGQGLHYKLHYGIIAPQNGLTTGSQCKLAGTLGHTGPSYWQCVAVLFPWHEHALLRIRMQSSPWCLMCLPCDPPPPWLTDSNTPGQSIEEQNSMQRNEVEIMSSMPLESTSLMYHKTDGVAKVLPSHIYWHSRINWLDILILVCLKLRIAGLGFLRHRTRSWVKRLASCLLWCEYPWKISSKSSRLATLLPIAQRGFKGSVLLQIDSMCMNNSHVKQDFESDIQCNTITTLS